MRVAFTCYLQDVTQVDMARVLAGSEELDLHIVTDAEEHPEIPFIDSERIHYCHPTQPETLARFNPVDRRAFRSILDEIDPDIMISMGISDLIFMSAAAGFSPSVLVVQGGEKSRAIGKAQWTKSRFRSLYYRYVYRPIFKDLLRHVDEVWCPEPNREVFRELGVGDDAFRSFDWPVVDTERFRPDVEDPVGYCDDADVTVVGSFRRVRGYALEPSYDTFFDAIAGMGDLDDLHIVIGGLYADKQEARPVKELMEERISELSLEDDVTRLDIVPKADLPRYYAGLDVYINFTHKGLVGGIGASSKEAMASGCAFVTFDDPSPEYVIDDGVNGLVVSHDEPGLLRRYIEELAADDDRTEELGERARETIVQNFSEPVLRQRIERICRELVDDHR